MENEKVQKTTTKGTLPPVKTLFTESFHLLKNVFAPFIVFNILFIIITVAAVIMMLAGLFLLGIGIGITGQLQQGSSLVISYGFVAVVILFFVLISIISAIGQIGSVIILYDANPKIGVFSVIKRSAKYIIPLITMGIISTFLVIGGIFILLIPAIIFSILFTFSFYSVITENKGPISALKRSVFLVKNNFTAFFLRILALWGVMILISMVFSFLIGWSTEGMGEGVAVLFSIFNFVVQILASWYAMAYTTTLFKQLQKVSPAGESSLKIIVLLSIVGWVIGIAIGYFAFNGIVKLIELQQSGELENQLTPSEQEELDKIFQEIDGDFKIEDIDQYMEDSLTPTQVETSTSPAETI